MNVTELTSWQRGSDLGIWMDLDKEARSRIHLSKRIWMIWIWMIWMIWTVWIWGSGRIWMDLGQGIWMDLDGSGP